MNNTGQNPEISPDTYTAKSKVFYAHGIPIGSKKYDYEQARYNYFIYNHLTFNIKLHHEPRYGESYYAIVGFDIVPISINYKSVNVTNSTQGCNPSNDYTLNFIRGKQSIDEATTVYFTYDIEFQVK